MTTEAKDKTDNELIANFLGFSLSFDKQLHWYHEESRDTCWMAKEANDACWNSKYLRGADDKTPIDYLRYHESWDWLMPVVEKIYSLGYFVHMIVDPMFTEPASCAIISSRKAEVINSVKRSTLIDAVYNSCIHFIRWYNANQPKP